MRCSLLAIALVFGVSGCSQDSNNSGPPDLTMKDLVGCWQNRSDSCSVLCYDQGSGFLSENGGNGVFDAREDSGSYSLQGDDVYLTYVISSAQGIINRTSGDYVFVAASDGLKSVNSDGTYTATIWSRVSPDSFSCGIKPWRFFQKPAGWDSLVKPLQ